MIGDHRRSTMRPSSSSSSFFFFFSLFFFSSFSTSPTAAAVAESPDTSSSIVFATLGRSRYAFDIFSVAIPPSSDELRLTDGISVNYNGFFPSNSSSLLSLFSGATASSSSSSSLLYISERNASFNLFLNFFPSLPSSSSSSSSRRRSALRLPSPRLQFQIPNLPPSSMKDRPSIVISGDHLIYVSTHKPSRAPRQSWAAVYSTSLLTGRTTRLTPRRTADFSPAVSPSGHWTAVASSGDRGWAGEVQELDTDIVVFMTRDGSSRTKLVGHGGWPCWADERTLYFHRRSSDDGWWSIYRVVIDFTAGAAPTSSSAVRITPPGFHAFTPAASPGAPGILAAATRRPDSGFRHVELIKLSGNVNTYAEVTRAINPDSHHYNPFISPDGRRVGYHRCGGGDSPLLLESIESPSPESLSLFRIDGSFPSFSPAGDRIAFVGSSGLTVASSDGSGEPTVVLAGGSFFATAWDRKREGVIYTSGGPSFASVSTDVDIFSVDLTGGVKKLTEGGKNNAFPSPSPEGKWVVFRSGRSGHKNLYIMDAELGESSSELRRLTEGPWTDTMCNWSPDGEWIAFASDRHDPGGGSFAIYIIHPNGTGLRMLVHSGEGGRTNHPWFSPDSKKVVFTSDIAGVSAEPISNPHHYQPYGDIFTVEVDGSGEPRRLTHNSYEDGTPTWAPRYLKPADVAGDGGGRCRFEDCHWLAAAAAAGESCGDE